jgi:hypothetical protein
MVVEKGLQTMFATVLGAVLLLVGIIGFVNDPVLGIFDVNGLHNAVHLLSGLIGVWAGVWGGLSASRMYNRVFGVVYLLVAVLGFAGLVGGLLENNAADTYLHLLIGLVSTGIGFWGKD